MDTVATLRAFNRTWGRRSGVLDESFLGTGRPYGSARLLFEIEQPVTVRDLRTRLGLDSGYVSRLLRGLQREGLVGVSPDPDDGRRRVVSLTAAGRRARGDLDDRSEGLARGLLAELSPRLAEELGQALARADLLMRAATVGFEVVDPAGDDARTAVGAYLDELDRRFPTGFDAHEADHDADAMCGDTGRFLVARSDGDVVACGGVQTLGDGVGEIKRMWVHPDWRGAGLARRMLGRLEQEVAALGHRTVRLDTNDTLVEALSLYRSSGYREIERYNDNPYARHWFEKALTGSRAR